MNGAVSAPRLPRPAGDPDLLAGLHPFLVIGVAATVAGGVVAAITGPTGWDRGSWVAAFLVLVAGVGQIGLAAGQATFAARPPTPRRRAWQAAGLNGGCALVIGGTLAAQPVGVTIGGMAILAALASFRRSRVRHEVAPVWLARLYMLLLAVLIVSTPIGLLMAWTRA